MKCRGCKKQIDVLYHEMCDKTGKQISDNCTVIGGEVIEHYENYELHIALSVNNNLNRVTHIV